MKTLKAQIDFLCGGERFPRIHEGRYEVDLEQTAMTPPPDAVAAAVREAGVRLLRVGVGVWLPSQDPTDKQMPEREWFRGSSLEETKEESLYTWTHLDRVLEACLALGCEVLLSIDYMPATLALAKPKPPLQDALASFAPGYTFPNGVRNAPPADPVVFSEAVVHLLRHVDEAGVTIRYVELWNEPDLPFWWWGTYEEFFDMYSVFARRISQAGYRVGGPSSAGIAPEVWREQFLDDIVRAQVPLDFYSWHAYQTEPEMILTLASQVRKALDSRGLDDTESILDEWGYDLGQAPFWGTVANAAFFASCLMRLPDAGVAAQTHVLLVDPLPPEVGRFHGLTRKDGDPNPVWFVHRLFEDFQSTPMRCSVTTDAYLLAGRNDSDEVQIILSNPASEELSVDISVVRAEARGELRTLTQKTFESDRGWGSPVPARLGHSSSWISTPPHSVAWFRGRLQM